MPKSYLTTVILYINIIVLSIFFVWVPLTQAEADQIYKFQNAPSVSVAEPDIQGFLDAEATTRELETTPPRYGVPVDVSIDLIKDGSESISPSGNKIWSLEISSPNAKSISALFTNVSFPTGSEVTVYSKENQLSFGPFRFKNNNHDDTLFATPPYPGDRMIISLEIPKDIPSPEQLPVSKIVYGFVDIFSSETDEAMTEIDRCYNYNTICEDVAPWYKYSRSVVKTTSPTGLLCSAVLVNNTRKDMMPFILTAAHCLDSHEAGWTFWFNYESPTCSTTVPTSTTVMEGGTVLCDDETLINSDYALILLNEPIPDSYNVFYAGWSTVDSVRPNGYAVHHPGGQKRKISFSYSPVTEGTMLEGDNLLPCYDIRFDQGYTLPGSSGSPLFDQDNRVLGVLNRCICYCTEDRYGVGIYNKLSNSWERPEPNGLSLSSFLDPLNSNANDIDGFDGGDVSISADTLINDGLLRVSFRGTSSKPADSWTWDFGDGNIITTTTANPTHTFSDYGSYDIRATVNSGTEAYTCVKNNFINIVADTIESETAFSYPGKQVELTLYATNSMDLSQITIPVEYGNNPFNLTFASFSTAGCRTDIFDTAEIIHYDAWNKRLTISLRNSVPGILNPLPPGTGPIVKIKFNISSTALPDQSAVVIVSGYDAYQPEFANYFTAYTPETKPLNITITDKCCVGIRGNVDFDFEDIIDIADLVYFIEYSFYTPPGPAPTCIEEADIDRNGILDVADIVMLVDYQFRDGSAPPDCP